MYNILMAKNLEKIKFYHPVSEKKSLLYMSVEKKSFAYTFLWKKSFTRGKNLGPPHDIKWSVPNPFHPYFCEEGACHPKSLRLVDWIISMLKNKCDNILKITLPLFSTEYRYFTLREFTQDINFHTSYEQGKFCTLPYVSIWVIWIYPTNSFFVSVILDFSYSTTHIRKWAWK